MPSCAGSFRLIPAHAKWFVDEMSIDHAQDRRQALVKNEKVPQNWGF
jgi:hypothetical protein